MLPALYQLANDYRDALPVLAELDPTDPAFIDTLESLVAPLEQKAYNVACMSRTIDALAEAQASAAKELAARAAATAKRAEALREYLAVNMRKAGITRIDAAPDRPAFSLSFRKNNPSVVITDPAAIPSDYMRYPTAPPPAPDKTLIAKAIKDGYVVPGCELQQTERLHIG